MSLFGPTDEFKERQNRRDLAEAGQRQLTAEAIGRTFGAFQGFMAPTINALVGESLLSSQMAGRSTIANLMRMGLGNTGLGQALSAALQRGSVHQASSLRSRLTADLFANALNIQSQRAAGYFGGQATTAQFGNSRNDQIAQGLQQLAQSF